MFPGRFWLALGSGQRLNEGTTGVAWPEKRERNARLRECAEVIRAPLAGETVSHHGRITVVQAKLYSRPARPPTLLGAAVTEQTADEVDARADVLLTVSAAPGKVRKVVEGFRRGRGEGKRLVAQVGLNWAPTEGEALAGAHERWRFNVVGGEVNWELRLPEGFDAATRFLRPEDTRESVWISPDLGWHADRIAELAELGFNELQLHQVGRNQRAFIDAFGEKVLPALRR